jgi:tetratricopeptide (TPR) repeat protein
MSTYLGNPSLSTAVKERVSSTFQQALGLYKQGRSDEVIAGCNLILQMDPSFDPAKKLLEKTRNPSLPIDVDALVPESADGAMSEARSAMASRDFQRVVNITTEVLTNDLMNDDARILGDEAREKIEAGPFVEQFVKKCEQHIASGNMAAARQDLDKARSLDPGHPSLRKIEQMIGGQAAAQSSGFGSNPQPSFVVDAPPPPAAAPGRSAAQASDFGFTFEEEKSQEPSGFAGFSFDAPSTPAATNTPFGGGGGFSFDAPPTAPAAPSGGFSFDAAPTAATPPSGDFDFSTASMDTSPDDRKKIEQYLADGDRAFEGGDYQQAIDLWSRIFLIDVTNDQASERIERAKAKRREIDQKVESLIAAGVASFDRSDHENARARFTEALRIDPANSTAHDYLDRLSNAPTEGGALGVESNYEAPAAEKYDIFDEDSGGTYDDAAQIPPEAAAAPAAAKKTAAKPAKAAAKKKSSMAPIIAVIAVVVLAAGGWFVWSAMSKKTELDPAKTQAVFSEAGSLAKRGQYDQAIAQLQEIKPDDPQHDRAVLMIADLERKKSQASALIDGKSAEVFFNEQIAAGRAAFDTHDYDGAKKALEQATRVRPLPPDAKSIYETAAQQVAKLDAAKGLFRERRYSDAIANLQPLAQQDPQNLNIQRMLADAHFDLGAQALQEERLPDAIKEFDEVLKVSPGDDLAKRSREIAARYDGQPKDLLYKIYVKYLPLR